MSYGDVKVKSIGLLLEVREGGGGLKIRFELKLL